ncbi:MAG: S1C family serine protease [Candidatus Omnitrophica bacterium]|nr:S1C family serine protease [Candidatus Omnitrophota bacterium]
MKYKLRFAIAIIVLVIIFIVRFSVCAETIVFRSGKIMQAKIIERTNKYIKVDIQGIPITYYIEEIESIDGVLVDTSVSSTKDTFYQKEPKDIYKKISSAIVNIEVITIDEESLIGSGFIIDSQGIVITNYHLIEKAKAINVKLKEGQLYPVTSILSYDTYRDICLLKINASNLPYISLGNSDTVQVGEKVYCIGNPLGLEYSFSDGLVSGIRNFQGIKWLQFTAPISLGNSGSPLINSNGQAIGIVTFLIRAGQNINFALAINEIKPFILRNSPLNLNEFAKITHPNEPLVSDPKGLAGTYKITYAYNPSTYRKYTGTVDIIPKKDTYKLVWKFSGSLTYEGIGIVMNENILCVGWDVPGSYYGIVVYKIKGNRLEGKWATVDSDLIGTEDLEGHKTLEGEYSIVNSFSPSSGKGYTGKVFIRKFGKVYILDWKLPSETYSGVGLLQDDLLIVGWGFGQNCGVVYYKITDKSLIGFWTIPQETDIGKEDLIKISDKK